MEMVMVREMKTKMRTGVGQQQQQARTQGQERVDLEIGADAVTPPPDPDGQNQRRAESAADTLNYFARKYGEHYETETVDEARALAEQNLADLLCDSAHFCDQHGLHLSEVLRRAAGYYAEEATDDDGVGHGEQVFCGEGGAVCVMAADVKAGAAAADPRLALLREFLAESPLPVEDVQAAAAARAAAGAAWAAAVWSARAVVSDILDEPCAAAAVAPPQIIPDDGTEPHAADCPSRHCGECLCGVADRAESGGASKAAVAGEVAQ